LRSELSALPGIRLKPLFDAQNDSRSKTEVVMEVTGSEIRNVVELRA